jgi:hypothetical protein
MRVDLVSKTNFGALRMGKRRDREGETLRSIGRSYNFSAATIARLADARCRIL